MGIVLAIKGPRPGGRRSKRQRLAGQALMLLLALLLFTCKAQQKSQNIQVVNGKRFYIHKIEKKQSLYSISRLYNVSVDTLFKLNPELKEGAKANQEIKVPFESAPQSTAAATIDSNKFLTHSVAKGETVYSISRRYGISEKQLKTYNPVIEQGLREGQLLIVGEKGKRKGRENKTAPSSTVVSVPPLPVDSSLFRPFSKPSKAVYNISLLLPFKLDEILNVDLQTMLRGNGEFPLIPALATDFYLGCRKAMDSLSTPQFSLNLQLYDVDDKDSLQTDRLSRDPEFAKSDLVIGPLYVSGFKSLAQRASELHTPIVSPFTQTNKILYNNIYISKTNPSQYTLLENLADYCLDSLSGTGTNFILMTVSARDKKEGNYAESFKSYFNARLNKLGRPATDTIRSAKTLEALKLAYRPGARNVVIALSTNQVFIADFTTQLALFAADKDIVLCGWESVTGMDNIDQEYLNQLQYTFPHQYDVTRRTIPALDHYYKQKQLTSPTEYFYIGFEVAYYYLKHLRDHGPDFVYQLDQLPMESTYMRFRFTRPDLITGFDNRGAYIFRYKDYQLHKTGWR
jgi:LysM repeat protein